MEEVFAAIAEKEKGNFKADVVKYTMPDSSKMFVSHYYLEVDYKGHQIHIYYEMGNHNMAKAEVQLLPGENFPQFSITNRSHYYRLFYRKANILKVECTSNTFKKYLEELLASTNLELLARENLFEPQMRILQKDVVKVLSCEFHLVFGDKEGVLYGLIAFYKSIVDRL